MSEREIVRPAALRIGDTVGVIAPAGPVVPDALEAGCKTLSTMGYKPVYLSSITNKEMYFAGSLQRRVDELHEMFARPEVRAIICARGGYGCNYLLPKLDLDLIRENPKIFVGYSDISSLLTYINDATGLVTFHGPMVAKDFAVAGGIDADSWMKTTGGARYEANFNANVIPLVRGNAEGRLYGGCLSMLTASLGTPYEIRTKNSVLFIEDVTVWPYQIDRMLMQLRLAGKFDGVRGIIFGDFRDCEPSADAGYTLQDVIMGVVGDLGVPIAYGLRSGHVCGGNRTLPIGVKTALTVDDKVSLVCDAATTEK